MEKETGMHKGCKNSTLEKNFPYQKNRSHGDDSIQCFWPGRKFEIIRLSHENE